MPALPEIARSLDDHVASDLRGPELRDCLERLERLESALDRERRRTRRLAAASATLLAAVGGAGLVAATGTTGISADGGPILQVSRLEIVDDGGRLVAAVGGDERGGRVDLWNSDGANVLRLSSNADGGDLNLWNGDGRSQLAVWVGPGGGRLAAWNAEGERAIGLEHAAGGPAWTVGAADGPRAILSSGRAVVTDGAGHAAGLLVDPPDADAAAGNAGAARLVLAGPDRPRAVELAADASGGSATFAGAGGVDALALGGGDGGGAIDLFDAGGARVGILAPGPTGGGRLELLTSEGRLLVAAEARSDLGGECTIFGPGGDRGVGLGGRAGGGVMNLFNRRGVAVVAAGFVENELGGAVTVRNLQGLPVVELTSEPTPGGGEGRLRLSGPDGTRPRSLGPLPGGGGP